MARHRPEGGGAPLRRERGLSHEAGVFWDDQFLLYPFSGGIRGYSIIF